MALELPPPDHTRLPGAELVNVVCQINFDAQESVSDAAAVGRPFFDAMRAEYPNLAQLRSEQLTIGLNVPGSGEMARSKGWRAATGGDAWIVILLPDRLAIESRRFTTFGELEQRLRQLLEVVVGLVEPALSERIGLRFINALGVRGAEPGTIAGAASILSEPFRGPAATPHLSAGLQRVEGVANWEAGNGLTAAVRWAFSGVDRAVIDIDVFRGAPTPFSAPALAAEAIACNDVAVQLFHAVASGETLANLREPR